jgi:NAD(P)-dependent dehydrogenase (short-subunit alcohol dehydrogenase family)
VTSPGDFPEGVAVVVGGSGGVGAVACTKLAEAGTDVVATYLRHEDAALRTAAIVEHAGRRASIERVDVADADAVVRALDAIAGRHGRIHTVVHAAGSKIDQPFVSEVDVDQWRKVIDADVNGFFHIARAALPHLRAGGGGSLVFVSSAGITRYPAGDVLSVAPKAACEALLRAIAKEEGRYGIRANAVQLGVIDAGMFPELVARGEITDEWVNAAKKNTPLRRFGTAAEVADAIVFLASTRASYVTGQSLRLDGGYGV